MGIETDIATSVTRSVPENTGTMPKDPSLATWSSLIAVCGLHVRPNKKSKKGIFSKKRIASKIKEKTIPIVAKIATIEQSINRFIFVFSTACLDLKVTETFFKENILAKSPNDRIIM